MAYMGYSQNYGPFLAIDYITALTRDTKMGPEFWDFLYV